MEPDGSSTFTRVLGVMAAAVLAIATFGALGIAVVITMVERGLAGRGASDGLESLTYLWIGVIGGTAVGVVVAVWVGLRVWHSQWTLLLLLAALACVTAVILAIASSA